MKDLTNNERLNLSKMIRNYNASETTSKIRELRHSKKIKEDVAKIIKLKKEYSRIRISNYKQFREICEKRCDFLYTNYTNIFNRLIKDELNENVLFNFIDILSEIEDGKLDQHEGSYKVGMILKKLYIDTKLNDEKGSSKKINKKPIKKIKWNEFKMIHLEK